jgi:hypothetical protein
MFYTTGGSWVKKSEREEGGGRREGEGERER